MQDNQSYETKNLARFLERFDDQALANFQAATEDRTISFWNPCRCVIGYFNHNQNSGYIKTKCHSGFDEIVLAEIEYGILYLDKRHDLLLDLIKAEWERRQLVETMTIEEKQEFRAEAHSRRLA